MPTAPSHLAAKRPTAERRILHAGGDATGAEMVRALAEAVRRAPWIEIVEETFVEDLLVADGRVVGALAIDRDGAWRAWAAGAVVLATGGIGQLYRFTTNPLEATGDGVAIAARAGARLADLEFVQFHPTALAAPGFDPLPLLTEALRGEGSVWSTPPAAASCSPSTRSPSSRRATSWRARSAACGWPARRSGSTRAAASAIASRTAFRPSTPPAAGRASTRGSSRCR